MTNIDVLTLAYIKKKQPSMANLAINMPEQSLTKPILKLFANISETKAEQQ